MRLKPLETFERDPCTTALGRHKSFDVLGEYLEYGNLFDAHPLKGLLYATGAGPPERNRPLDQTI